ncbi:MAG TPA: DNA/RNA nuclease SfsA [bacterium]|nr:DNA/RNA nuclease SfsA [bacterium]
MAIHVMHIPATCEAEFLVRPNRFLGLARLPGSAADTEDPPEKIHIHDPGRLKELLFPGNRILLRRADNPDRKTRWDLIAARYRDEWILVNSSFHRGIAEAVFRDPQISPFPEMKEWRAEVTIGHSRLDFMGTVAGHGGIPRTLAIETKGCTLAVNGTALFPDAPTTRGARHLDALINLKSTGTAAAVLMFVFRPDALRFAPFAERDPLFAARFRAAAEAGVDIRALLMRYDGKSLWYLRSVPVITDIPIPDTGGSRGAKWR